MIDLAKCFIDLLKIFYLNKAQEIVLTKKRLCQNDVVVATRMVTNISLIYEHYETILIP